MVPDILWRIGLWSWSSGTPLIVSATVDLFTVKFMGDWFPAASVAVNVTAFAPSLKGRSSTHSRPLRSTIASIVMVAPLASVI